MSKKQKSQVNELAKVELKNMVANLSVFTRKSNGSRGISFRSSPNPRRPSFTVYPGDFSVEQAEAMALAFREILMATVTGDEGFAKVLAEKNREFDDTK